MESFLFVTKFCDNMVGIYKITSPSGKIYIGRSWNIEKRFEKDYKTGFSCKRQRKLYSSFLKYGWLNHKFEIVHILPVDVSKEVLCNYEIFYWQQYKDCGFEMLNIRMPGTGEKYSKYIKKKIVNFDILKNIYQYSLDGEFIKRYESIKNASLESEIKEGIIYSCCNGHVKSAGKFLWFNKFSKDFIDETFKNNTKQYINIKELFFTNL